MKGFQPPSSENLTTCLWINTFHLCRLCPLQSVLLSFLTTAESFSFLMSIETAETYSLLKGPSGSHGWMGKGSRPDPWTAGIVMWKKKMPSITTFFTCTLVLLENNLFLMSFIIIFMVILSTSYPKNCWKGSIHSQHRSSPSDSFVTVVWLLACGWYELVWKILTH